MTVAFDIRRLVADDALAVQDCFDSQPKVMMKAKESSREPYADTFSDLIYSGCIAYGAWNGGVLQAFLIMWPWPTLPASTVVMGCNRPTGQKYNPIRSGLTASFDACIAHMEADGRRIIYFVRSSGKAWKNSTITKGLGKFSHYHCTAVEHIKAGALSKYSDFNQLILGYRPVSSNAVIVAAVAPMTQDF